MALTPRQKEVLDFVSDFNDRNGYCPSYEEIATGLDLASIATVHKHIRALETKKYLKRAFNQSRSLEVSRRYYDEMPKPSGVPLLGRIAAGNPVEAYESAQTIAFTDFTGDKDTYALQVRGDSMIDDHICDGDYVLVEKTAEARNGEVVVALVRGAESTLKRIYREPDGMIRLQPANSTMAPIRLPAGDVAVQGRLLAVLRKYR